LGTVYEWMPLERPTMKKRVKLLRDAVLQLSRAEAADFHHVRWVAVWWDWLVTAGRRVRWRYRRPVGV
jgi:hypothetical protein